MTGGLIEAGLPVIPTGGCTGLLSPVCHAAGSAGAGIFSSGAGAVLSAVATWVVGGASWLLEQIGHALSSSTSVDLGAGWFQSHYRVMAGLAGVVILPLLILSVVQAVYRQTPGPLVRSVMVQLPLAALLTAAAVQLVQMALAVTDALSSTIASGSGTDVHNVLAGVANLLVNEVGAGPQSPPTFVVLLGGLLVAIGSFTLWVELLVRAAAVYVAVLFLPLALASLVWPAISHWCRRLADTLVALVLAKFVIVAVLSLAAAALASGTGAGFASVLGGGALLLLASFTPFTLLRLIPAVEAGAVHQLEGVRHRARQALGSMPHTAAAYALKAARSSSFETGPAGTGLAVAFEAAGGGGPGEGGAGEGGPGGGEGGPGGGAGGPGGGAGAVAGGPGGGAGAVAGGRNGSSPGRGGGGTDPVPGAPAGSVDTPASGPGGLAMWRGQPVAGPDVDEGHGRLADPAFVPWSEGGDPSGRGPLPLWGAPVSASHSPPAPAELTPSDQYSVEEDRMGPKMQWMPPDGGGPNGYGRD
ncbi:MAG: hypothetical protein ACYDHU_08660 [Acidimicrobiales bacterium]